MNKRFLTTIMVACALLVSSQAMFAREAPPSKSAPAQKAAPPAQKAAPAPAKAALAVPPTAKTAPASKPTLEAGPAARGAPPPLAKTTVPDSSGKVTSPPSSGAPAAQGKPSFDNAAAQAQKAQDQQATMKKAETERLAAAQAKRESDAAIARAQASSRGAAPSAGQSVTDTERIRRLEESNRALRANNERYERRARADAREAALRARYRDSYRFRSPYADIFAGAAIWSVWSSLSTHEQARWMYNHQYQMDSSRYQELLFSNAELRREVQSLERQQLTRDSSYVPPQLAGNEDLMYAQNATQIARQQAAEAQAELAAAQSATTNVPVTQTPVASVPPAASGGSHWIIWTTLLLVLIGGAAFVWLRREAK